MLNKFHRCPISLGSGQSESHNEPEKVQVFFGSDGIGEFTLEEVGQKILDEANRRGWKNITVKQDGIELNDLSDIEAGSVHITPYYAQG